MVHEIEFGSLVSLVRGALDSLIRIQRTHAGDRNERIRQVDTFVRRFITRDIDEWRGFAMDQIKGLRNSGVITFDESIPLQKEVLENESRADEDLRAMGEAAKLNELNADFLRHTSSPSAQLPPGIDFENKHIVACNDPAAVLQDLNGTCWAENIPLPPPETVPIVGFRFFQLEITASPSVMGLIQSNLLRIERVMARFGAFGWTVTSAFIEAEKFKINLTKEGSISVAAIIGIILGVLAALGIVSFSWRMIEGERTIQAAEQTEQRALGDLSAIVNNTDLPLDIREDAALKLIELSGPAVLDPPAIPDIGGGGFFGGLDPLALGAIAIAAVALLGSRR